MSLHELLERPQSPPSTPLVITAVAGEPVTRWSLEDVRSVVGDDTRNSVRFFDLTGGGGGAGAGGGGDDDPADDGRNARGSDRAYGSRILRGCEELSFAEFAAAVRSGDAARRDKYWAMSSPGPAFDERILQATHLADAERALGLRTAASAATSRPASHDGGGGGGGELLAWVGATNHIERLHYDDEDNLHLVCRGRKRWLLFPPASLASPALGFLALRPQLQAVLWGGASGAPLGALPLMPDGIGGDPASSAADPHKLVGIIPGALDVTLSPGDALFLPAGWAHQVESLPEVVEGGEAASAEEEDFVLSVNRFHPTPLYRVAAAASPGAFWQVARLRLFQAAVRWREWRQDDEQAIIFADRGP